MAWSIIHSINGRGTDTSTTTTLAANWTTTAGNTLIVVINQSANDAVSGMVVGSQSLVKLAASQEGTPDAVYCEIWGVAAIPALASPSVMITFGVNPGLNDITIYEATGMGGIVVDGSASNNNTGTAMTVGPITTTQSGDLVFKIFACTAAPSGIAQSGWTEFNPSTYGNIVGYIIQPTAGAITGTGNQGAVATNAYDGLIVAIKGQNFQQAIANVGIRSSAAFAERIQNAGKETVGSRIGVQSSAKGTMNAKITI